MKSLPAKENIPKNVWYKFGRIPCSGSLATAHTSTICPVHVFPMYLTVKSRSNITEHYENPFRKGEPPKECMV
jgi:hypothetical protein